MNEMNDIGIDIQMLAIQIKFLQSLKPKYIDNMNISIGNDVTIISFRKGKYYHTYAIPNSADIEMTTQCVNFTYNQLLFITEEHSNEQQ